MAHTELRIHGVSGTPPRDLLYTDPVSYDESGSMARVFELHKDDFKVKAFHWGSLTAGRSVTALWILLSPFALANAAGWMTDNPNRWTRTFCRLTALSLTCLFFAQISHMAMDIPYDALVARSDDPSVAAVLAIYAALTSILILGLIAVGTQSHFMEFKFATKLALVFHPAPIRMLPPEYWETIPPPAQWLDPAHGASLTGSTMWQAHAILHRLRRLHITAGLATLALVVAWGMESAALTFFAIAGLVLMMLLIALTTTDAQRPIVRSSTAVAPWLGMGLFAWSIVVIAIGPLTDTSLSKSGELTFIFAVSLGLMALLALVGEWGASWRSIGWKAVSKGWKAVGTLAVAAFFGASLGLTGALVAEDLTGLAPDGESKVLAQGGAWTSVAMLGLVALLLVVSLVLARIPLGTSQPQQTTSDEDLAPESGIRRVLLRAPWLFGLAGAYGLAMGLVAVISACDFGALSCDSEALPDWDVIWAEGWDVTFFGLTFELGSLTGWAKLLMVVAPAVFIFRSILGGLLRGQDSRRQVSILWDIGSFWNRWYHPLGPPAYSPTAVQALTDELHSKEPDILAAHSQGSLIAAVALNQLAHNDPSPRFLTYGSQLGGLYPTMFPAVGLDALIEAVKVRVGGLWINLWRRSDAIGGQFIEGLGPANWHVNTGSGHSRYELAPEFCQARLSLLLGNTVRPRQQELADCWDRPTHSGSSNGNDT